MIPWEEEAELTLKGVFWKIPHQNRTILTFDIGGGSDGPVNVRFVAVGHSGQQFAGGRVM